ncbi:MAG: bifunctional DNA primase/polymerase [Rubrobacter sp.]|nr:bifunctional DNA primase/polymerase [Rubrobacter sp.]
MIELREAALGYAHRGWRVFPLHGIVNEACTCGRTDCSSAGKHPLVRRGLYEATTDPDVIMEWWRRWRSANVGIATGAVSGLAVIDVDLPAAFVSLGRLIEQEVPATLTGLTGGGGVHLVFSSSDETLGNSAGRLPGMDDELTGFDLRGNGGYIVAPPSVHRSGGSYEWLDANRPVAAAPAWLKQPERTYVALEGCQGDGLQWGRHALRVSGHARRAGSGPGGPGGYPQPSAQPLCLRARPAGCRRRAPRVGGTLFAPRCLPRYRARRARVPSDDRQRLRRRSPAASRRSTSRARLLKCRASASSRHEPHSSGRYGNGVPRLLVVPASAWPGRSATLCGVPGWGSAADTDGSHRPPRTTH